MSREKLIISIIESGKTGSFLFIYHEREREVESIVDSAIRLLVDRDHGILKKVRQFEAVGGVEASIASRTRYTLEESRYISSQVENYLYEVSEGILNPLQKLGISLDDAGTYLFLKRVQTERKEMANPLELIPRFTELFPRIYAK